MTKESNTEKPLVHLRHLEKLSKAELKEEIKDKEEGASGLVELIRLNQNLINIKEDAIEDLKQKRDLYESRLSMERQRLAAMYKLLKTAK